MSMVDYSNRALALREVFQMAILDLSNHVRVNADSLSEEDIENTHLVCGLASLNAFNLDQVVAHGEGFYNAHKEKADRLLREAGELAASLQKSGYGKGRVVH